MDVLKIFVSSLNITRSFGFIFIINVKYKIHMFHFRFAQTIVYLRKKDNTIIYPTTGFGVVRASVRPFFPSVRPSVQNHISVPIGQI